MNRLSVGEAEIEYTERGDGEPMVLVHAGVFSDWFVPLSSSPALDGFRVIRVRRAGYGDRPPAGHVTLAEHARLAAAVADHLGVGAAHWVGHSSGCQIVLQLALDRPERVASLVLLEPAPTGGFQAPASAVLGPFVGGAFEAFAAGDVATAFDRFMTGVCGPDHRAVIEAALGAGAYERAVRESAFFFGDELHAVQEWRFGAAEASRIGKPVLVVEGGDQPAHLSAMSHEITELALGLLRGAEAAIIPGTNHALPLQDADAVGEVIAAFARRHAAAS